LSSYTNNHLDKSCSHISETTCWSGRIDV